MQNYLNFWYKKTIKDGLKAIKLVLGLGLSFAIAFEIDFIIGLMGFSWVLVDTLIEKNS